MKTFFFSLLFLLTPILFAGTKTETVKEYKGIKEGQKAEPVGSFDVANGGRITGLERTLKEPEVKGVVLSVFGTYCAYCKTGILMLNKNKEALEKSGIKVLLISYNEPEEVVTEYVKANNLKLITLTDVYGELLKGYGITKESKTAFPINFLIDKELKIKKILTTEGEDFIEVIKGVFK